MRRPKLLGGKRSEAAAGPSPEALALAEEWQRSVLDVPGADAVAGHDTMELLASHVVLGFAAAKLTGINDPAEAVRALCEDPDMLGMVADSLSTLRGYDDARPLIDRARYQDLRTSARRGAVRISDTSPGELLTLEFGLTGSDKLARLTIGRFNSDDNRVIVQHVAGWQAWRSGGEPFQHSYFDLGESISLGSLCSEGFDELVRGSQIIVENEGAVPKMRREVYAKDIRRYTLRQAYFGSSMDYPLFPEQNLMP